MSALGQYIIVTLCYWKFTITDGALRMLVVLYFHELGYSALAVATLFLLYEFFGIVTNLFGGWLAAKVGLNRTMNLGLLLQLIALSMLLVDSSYFSVAYVMVAQAISGIAKDLNKMSAKSSIKLLVPSNKEGTLYRWVALLTGSKNTMKGFGFFIGAGLLTAFGFKMAIFILASIIALALLVSVILLKSTGKTDFKPKFTDIFSKSQSINLLSAARFFLFGARDIWFVVALPVYLQTQLQWSHIQVGGFIAFWVIGYGVVQSFSPIITKTRSGFVPDGRTATKLAFWLSSIPLAITLGLSFWSAEWVITIGLILFGIVFAVNSSVHSFLIVSYAKAESVSLDVGFYYMANAAGRLVGTLLSGLLYQIYGLEACLLGSMSFIIFAGLLSLSLPITKQNT